MQQQVYKNNNSSVNSIISLVCAIIPLVLFSITIDGLIVSIYYLTIGIPLFLIWLICGIIGLKSEKRNLAIASLIIKPVGIIIIIIAISITHW